MKKAIYLIGIIVVNLIMFGSLFKVLHWSGANIMFTLGSLLFSLCFLPIALYTNYKETRQYQLLHWVTFLVFALGKFSILFKVLHWTGNELLLQISFPLPFILFLPVYLYETRAVKKTNDIHFLGILFGLTFIAVLSVLLSLHA